MTNKNKNQRNGSQRVNINGKQSVAQIVKQVLNSQEEQKFILSSFSSGVDTTMQNLDMTSIPNGTTVSSRIGASVKLKKLKLKWTAALGDTTNRIRVLIFHWKPNDAVDVPQESELYQTTGVLAPLLKIKPNRYKLLKDLLITMDTYHPIVSGDISLDLGQIVSYTPGVDTGMNHLYMSVKSDSGGVPNPTFEFNACVYYTDN